MIRTTTKYVIRVDWKDQKSSTMVDTMNEVIKVTKASLKQGFNVYIIPIEMDNYCDEVLGK